MKDKSISILGCGWLGLPLGERLRVEGWQIKGSTTSKDKLKLIEEKGIEAHLVELNPDISNNSLQSFLNSNVLIINIPPRRDENVLEVFISRIKQLINEAQNSPIEKILFISSTSVYGEDNTTVTENSKLNPASVSGKALVVAEELFRSNKNFDTTILRFAGLIGPDRLPGRFLAGRDTVRGGNAKVNLIHLDDCIEIIVRILKQNVWGEIFNAAADEHPNKKTLYTKASEKIGIGPPLFSEDNTAYKIVSSEKLKAKLNYEFKYPNPLEMF